MSDKDTTLIKIPKEAVELAKEVYEDGAQETVK